MKRAARRNRHILRVFGILLFAMMGFDSSLAQDVDEDAVRERYEQIGEEAVRNQFDRMRSDIDDAAKLAGEDGRFMVSTDVSQFREIPRRVTAKIEARQKAIKRIIWQAAADIEQERSAEVVLEGGQLDLAPKDRERIEKLNSALRGNSLSMGSLALAIKMVVDLSADLYQDAINESDPSRKTDLYIEYTAFAYELGSIIVDLIEDFQQVGEPEIREIYAQRKQEVERLKARIDNRKQKYSRDLDSQRLDEAAFREKVKSLDDWIGALDASLMGWNKIFSILDEQSEWSRNIRSKADVFRDMRDDAGLQLEVLREVKIARDFLDYLHDLEEITEIGEIPLLPLDANLVRGLLGIDDVPEFRVERSPRTEG